MFLLKIVVPVAVDSMSTPTTHTDISLNMPDRDAFAGRRTAVPNELVDVNGRFAEHYDATPGTFYLIRPDQHVAARWRHSDAAALGEALTRAIGRCPARTNTPIFSERPSSMFALVTDNRLASPDEFYEGRRSNPS